MLFITVDSPIAKPLLFKGAIAIPSDFPTLISVESGWFYQITANVTDSDATKTHTHQSFLAGEEIAWNGSAWVEMGSIALLVRTGTVLSPANTNDSMDLGSGSYLTTGSIGATGSRVLKGWFTDLEVTNPIITSGIASGSVNGNTLLLKANDTTFMTFTTGASDTCSLSGDITGVTQTALDNSTKLATTAYVDGGNFFSRGGTAVYPKTSGDVITNYINNIVTTPTDAILIHNITNAVVGVPVQIPGRIHYKAGVWNTTGGGSEDIWNITAGCILTSGLTTGASYRLGFGLNTVAYTYPFEFFNTGLFSTSKTALAATSSDGILLQNTTAAVSPGTLVEMSPRIRMRGSAYVTPAVGSQFVDCISELLPISGATASGIYRIGFSINGGAYTYPYQFRHDGYLSGLTSVTTTFIALASYMTGADSSYTWFQMGTNTASANLSRNTANAYSTLVINNLNAGSTGRILECQAVSVTQTFIDRNGKIAGIGLNLPNIVNKVASANIRNSHNAEATSTSATYVKVKTITLPYGLLGSQRFIFEIKTSDAVTPETAYGQIRRNGVALGTEQSDVTGAYVSKSEDITQTWNPNDTAELWIKIGNGDTVSVQNFSIGYDDAPTVAVTSVNS